MRKLSDLGGKRHPNFKDRTGQTFGRLFVLVECVTTKGEDTFYLCKCDCGAIKIISSNHFVSGHAVSCGCFSKEATSLNRTTHGMTKTRTYRIWAGMIDRCTNHGATSYPNYGGRGITVCDRWRSSFEAFYADMGECPPGLSIDRLNGSEGYSLSNCKWSTRTEQNRNKRNVKLFDFEGRIAPLVAICEFFGMSAHNTYSYLYRNREGNLYEYIRLRCPYPFSDRLEQWTTTSLCY